MLKKYEDVVSGGFFLVFSISLYCMAEFTLPPVSVTKSGAGILPKVLASLMFLLSVVVVYRGIAKPSPAAGSGGVNRRAVLLSFAAIFVYVVLMRPLGFVPSSVLYLTAQMTILSNYKLRRIPLYAVISVAFSFAVFYFFTKALYLLLPAGILG